MKLKLLTIFVMFLFITLAISFSTATQNSQMTTKDVQPNTVVAGNPAKITNT